MRKIFSLVGLCLMTALLTGCAEGSADWMWTTKTGFGDTRIGQSFYAYTATLPDHRETRRINEIDDGPDYISRGGNWRDINFEAQYGPPPEGYWYDQQVRQEPSGQYRNQGSSTDTRNP